MIRTYGSMPEKPAGYFKAVEFPVLALLDKKTGDGRMLLSAGADTRELPLSIRFQTQSASGHDGARVSGALFEVTVDPESGVMSGRGYLLNDANGREHARLIKTGAMRGNSVDLADARARLVMEDEMDDSYIEFTSFRLAATTGVATPAFADARAVISEDMSEEELMASLETDEPLIVTFSADDAFVINVLGIEDDEVVASGATRVPFDAFYQPETAHPQKIVVTEEGFVYGHLALWESCHDGYADKCLRVPRPTDGYASFNKPGPLTERGQVETGPIFAFGGHRSAKSARTIEDAYGGIENAWADVRVVEGRFGPWLSGVVRPGVADEIVYAVRASRISGHWVNGRLKAIVSVNAEGYDVPGMNVEITAGFAFASDGESITELVASFPQCADEPDTSEVPAVGLSIAVEDLNDIDIDKLRAIIEDALDDGSVEQMAVNLVPPRGARREAQRGLDWVAEGHGGDGLEEATIGRARSMARGEARSPETVRRMRDFFNRHQSDKRATGFRPGEDGFPSPGRVAWALWGGDAGWRWARRTSDALDREAENSASDNWADLRLADLLDDDRDE